MAPPNFEQDVGNIISIKDVQFAICQSLMFLIPIKFLNSLNDTMLALSLNIVPTELNKKRDV